MLQQHELDAAVSTTSSESTPNTLTLVVCFDAESVHFTKKSTIIQLCNSAKKADGSTIVYYASPTTIKSLLKANSIINYTKHVLSPGSIFKELVMAGYHFLMQNCAHPSSKAVI
ncbi:hypothetical protein PILCRDRAFT_13848 [Piloderma croceum F 1598]|uniref:T6SS Phospholipase effector Tle1-like catalytic domain-containing protein n=1 Tax=Piloderma croceum (strain F 1598) TaxID=765440 RepID=A0A0C3F586_PILCF|nr:hypothetical protein PILCRDRAFT_13848 [Piloderma croceum F 1598]